MCFKNINLLIFIIGECHLSALVKLIKEVNDWEILGIHLGIKDAVIKDIKALNHYQPAPSRKDMLVTWLKCGNGNREVFIEALKSIGQLRIVQEILSQNGNNNSGKRFIIISNYASLCTGFFNCQTILSHV